MANPFDVLGFNYKAFRGLSKDEVLTLVRHQYRALQKIHHPDLARTDRDRDRRHKIIREINEAYELLTEKPEDFAMFFEKFMKITKGRQRISELEQQIQAAEEKAHENFLSYCAAQDARINPEGTAYGFTGTLNMYDTIRKLMMASGIRIDEAEGTPPLFFEMNVLGNGVVVIRKQKKEYRSEGKYLIGTIDDHIANQRGGIARILARAKTVWTPSKSQLRLTEATELKKAGLKPAEIVYIEPRISPEQFQDAVRYLKPVIRKGGYLFSVNRADEGTYFSLEGKVVGFESRD